MTVTSGQRERARTRRRGRPRDAGADDRILATAFGQLVRYGYGGLSMESVAAEAGVAKTTIYRRYPAKRDLVIAALTQEVPFEPPPPDLPTRDALERFIHLAVEVLIHSGAVRILASLVVEDQREPGILEVFRSRILAPRRSMVVAMLERGIERGDVRPDIDPLLVAEMVAGAVFGHHVILGEPATEGWIDALVDHVWNSIAAR
jgi:AcrR family transcriptional regulator